MTLCSRNTIIKIGDTGFYLEKYPENELYYIQNFSTSESGVGILDGTVKMIGYDERYLLVVVESIFWKNGKKFPDECYLIHVTTKKIEKITANQLQLYKKDKGIHLHHPNYYFR